MARDSSAAARARWHAIWALDAIDAGQAGRDAILAAAQDRDASVRRQALRQLGTRQTRAAVPVLLARLNDGDAGVRFQAATALGRIGDSTAVPKLLAALEERDVFSRYAVFAALNRIGRKNGAAWQEIARGLESGNQAVREGTGFALRETYENALLEVLLEMASDSKGKLETRENALRLATPLHHKTADWKGEWWAYHPALAAPPEKNTVWAGTSKIISALSAMLDDAEPRLRLAAVNGLEVTGDVESAAKLRSRFEQEPLPEVRRAIIHALGQFKDGAFSASLARLLRDRSSEPATLAEAARAAGRIGGDEAKAALLDMVAARSVDSTLRLEIINALDQLKPPGTVVALEPLLSDADPSIRTAAIKAVAHAGGDDALRALRPLLRADSTDLRREAVAALGGLPGRNAVPDLLAAWRAPETREAALAGLAQVSDVRALDAYLDGLSSGNAALREQCRKALTPIRDAALPLIEPRTATLEAVALAELRRIYKDQPQAERGPLFAGGKRTLELADYEKYALQHAGNPIRGQRTFFDERSVACIKCHAVAGHGGAIGPDLTLIGGQFPRRDLVEHVLEPSKVVREGYQQIVIETREGETFSGLSKGETRETLTLLDTEGRLREIAKNTIATRAASTLSLMPDGLQYGLTLQQFADLIGFLESRRADPRATVGETTPAGFAALFDGRGSDLGEWREMPEGTKRVHGLERDSAEVKARKGAEAGTARGARAPLNPERGVSHSAAGPQPEFLADHSVALSPPQPPRLETSRAPAHWRSVNGVLEHDGQAADLWTKREFGDFELRLEWRWPDAPKWDDFPILNRDGNAEIGADGRPETERVLEGGNSGVFLRGFAKARVNLSCDPVGSGEVWEYRSDPRISPGLQRALTPRKQADRPVGDWNRMEIRLRGDGLTVVLNGEEVIAQAPLPGIPGRGPIGLQHKRGRIQFRNVFIREMK